MAGKPTGIKILKNNFENALRMAGISKIKLAAASGVQLRKLQKNVNQTGRMSYDDLIAICKVIDTDPRYIIENDFENYKKWSTAEKASEDSFTNIIPGTGKEKRVDENGIYIQSFDRYKFDTAGKSFSDSLRETLNTYLMPFDFYSLRSEEEKEKIMNELFSAALKTIQNKTSALFKKYPLTENEDS